MSAVQASANEPTSRAYSTSPLAREVVAGSISPKVTWAAFGSAVATIIWTLVVVFTPDLFSAENIATLTGATATVLGFRARSIRDRVKQQRDVDVVRRLLVAPSGGDGHAAAGPGHHQRFSTARLVLQTVAGRLEALTPADRQCRHDVVERQTEAEDAHHGSADRSSRAMSAAESPRT